MALYNECSGCGSTLETRKRNMPDEKDYDLRDCPHCYGKKCCMCDMGDDVACLNCENDENEDEDE